MTGKAALLSLTLFSICVAQKRPVEPPARYPSRGTHAAIATGSEYASAAALRLSQAGGNAVDAGVAAMFAAAVTEFSHVGFGGEAPILIRLKSGEVKAIAGVGTMPKLASAELFRSRPLVRGEVMSIEPGGMKKFIPVAGIMPALVPGMVEAGLVALREYGTKSFAEVVAPAVMLADGMAIDEQRAGAIARSRRFLSLWPDSKRVFLPEGQVPLPGTIFRQPDLARTLRAMIAAEQQARNAKKSRVESIDAVRDYFYRGDVAHKIDAFSKAHEGLLRYEDMASFRLQPEDALSTTYRGYTVYKPGFWSQGPAMLEALNMLEGDDLRSLGQNSPEYVHRLVEVLKLAYADRDTYYGDPRFNKIPPALLTKEYAKARRSQIGPKASLEFRAGSPGGQSRAHPSQMNIPRTSIDDELLAKDTTCIDIVDQEGVMFSATPSGAWMPSVIAGDTGIPLTQRAQSFLLVAGHPNELAGGKRPRVTLSPTLVVKENKPFLALSTPGGDNQEQSLLQLLLNVVEFNMNAEQAVEAPRFQTEHLVSSFDNHAMNPGELLLDDRLPAATIAELQARGHQVSMRNKWGSGAAPVMVRVTAAGVLEAGADPYGYRTSIAW